MFVVSITATTNKIVVVAYNHKTNYSRLKQQFEGYTSQVTNIFDHHPENSFSFRLSSVSVSSLRGRRSKGNGKGIRAQDHVSLAPKTPFPKTPTSSPGRFSLPFQTPAAQANLFGEDGQGRGKCLFLKTTSPPLISSINKNLTTYPPSVHSGSEAEAFSVSDSRFFFFLQKQGEWKAC